MKYLQNMFFFGCICVLVFWESLAPVPAAGQGLQFGLLAKSVTDQNFIDAGQGCMEEARKNGDVCLLLGNAGPASPRDQVEAIRQAYRRYRFAAVAVSVINSGLVGAELRSWDRTVPVITFDSGFADAEAALSRAYVGMDNAQFGRDLARLAMKLRPHGGRLCLMADLHDTNLLQRIDAVRRELSGIPALPSGRHLAGERGWTESIRCPWACGDDVGRTMQQVELTLAEIRPDVLLSVGHWPIMDPAAYRRMVEPFRQSVLQGQTVVLCAAGTMLPEQRALLDEGLVHGVVSADFTMIGRKCYDVMRKLAAGESAPSRVIVPNRLLGRP